jgi:hypothetical protein
VVSGGEFDQLQRSFETDASDEEDSAIFWRGGRRSVAIKRAEIHADFYNG